MSGIVGIVNLDGAPMDRSLLTRMTAFLSYRGPDAQQTWTDGHVGFGHTMLRTTFESLRENQPCSLDGRVWITADARVDDRAGLIAKLKGKGHGDCASATDVELILHAYNVWGDQCVEHLIGDFTFAIWDAQRRSLFCARDHFGVKPFYYALVNDSLIFSNTLNCVRAHPAVSDDLNDLAIADFLLFDCNQDVSTTSFADIRRLPPAHCLTLSSGLLRPRRYWDFPIEKRIVRYKKAAEYIEHFSDILRKAVGDRVRADRIAVWMSGGLDSTTLAATACESRDKMSAPFGVQAYCGVYDSLIPDDERYYSGLVAKALRIPIDYLALDDYELYERWDEFKLHRPEPVQEPFMAQWVDFLERTSAHGRVAFYGEDGDALLSTGTVADMLTGTSYGETITAVARYLLSHRRRPPLGLGLYVKVKSWWRTESANDFYPQWLHPMFETRWGLKRRWLEKSNIKPLPIHPIHAETHRRLTHPIWQCFLESLDPGVTGAPLEIRLPLLDLRLVNYILAIPPLPWCVDKELMRGAMRGKLPETVRQRPKTPLAGNPSYELLRKRDSEWVDSFVSTPRLAQYVNRKAIPQMAGGGRKNEEVWINLRPLSLNYWLEDLQSSGLPIVNKRKSTGCIEEEAFRGDVR